MFTEEKANLNKLITLLITIEANAPSTKDDVYEAALDAEDKARVLLDSINELTRVMVMSGLKDMGVS